ncbi:MAG: SCO family protein [Pseudomonadota bacterium]|nr:SCO family protein [Pseudomonadota bacterium]
MNPYGWAPTGAMTRRHVLAAALGGMALAGCDWGAQAPLAEDSGKVLWEADPQALLQSAQGPVPLKDSLQGRALMLFFGYSQCPDICPTGLREMGNALILLTPEERARMRAVFVTVDPARDTVQVMREYVALFHPELLGLRLEGEPLKTLTRAFRVYYKLGEPDALGAYPVDHTALTPLVNAQGQLVKLLPYGVKADQLVSEIRKLL